MKVAVIPDAAMLIVNLVTKYGHEYLSSTNISPEKLRKDDSSGDFQFDLEAPPFNMTGKNASLGNKYTSNEAPSGLRGRLYLFENIIENSEAAIIMGQSKTVNHMYDTLNEMILFGCVGCNNQQNLVIKLLKQKNIPILQLKYPNSEKDLINMIRRTKEFLLSLDDLKDKKVIYNEDNLNVELRPYKEKISLNEFKDIINNYN